MSASRAKTFPRVLAVAAVSGVFCVAGVAPAQAAQPVTVDSCAATAQGEPGRSVALAPAAATPQILSALAPLDPLNVLRPALTGGWNSLPPIPVGSVGATDGLIPGGAIADAVLARLHEVSLLAPVIDGLGPPLKALLGADCGIPTRPGGPAPTAPVPSPPTSPGTPPLSPGDWSSGGGVSDAPGRGARLGQEIPGAVLSPFAPGGPAQGGVFGTGLPANGVPGGNGASAVPQATDVEARQLGGRLTGTAEALPASAHGGISPPALAAALLAVLVATLLIRRWILRRARPTS